MNCKKAERFLLRSWDGKLQDREVEALRAHLDACPSCRMMEKEYAEIMTLLRKGTFPELKPYFWERLRPKIREKKASIRWTVWKQWSLKAIPLSLLIVLVLAGGFSVFLSQPEQELTPTEALLLQNSTSLPESLRILEEEGEQNKSIQIIFMAMEEKKDARRYIP
ncbi:MAG: anti-sigma factor family protein [Candidatus Aminicenantales bacterium]